MFKKTLIFASVVALAVGVVAIALAQEPTVKKLQSPQAPQQIQTRQARIDWWNDAEIQKDLALNKIQISKLQTAWDNFDKDRNAIRAELRKVRQELELAFKAETIDSQKVNMLATKMADLEGKIIKNRTSYRLTVMQALTNQQRLKLGLTFKSKGVSTKDPTSPAGIVTGEVE